jgi:hypothetical protein
VVYIISVPNHIRKFFLKSELHCNEGTIVVKQNKRHLGDILECRLEFHSKEMRYSSVHRLLWS